MYSVSHWAVPGTDRHMHINARTQTHTLEALHVYEWSWPYAQPQGCTAPALYHLTLQEPILFQFNPKREHQLSMSKLDCSGQASYGLLAECLQVNATYNNPHKGHNCQATFQVSCPFNVQHSWLFNSLVGFPKQLRHYC